MNVFDLIFLILFIPAIVKGISKGFIEQIIAIASLFLSAFLAYLFADRVGNWLNAYIEGVSKEVLYIISFIVIIIVTVLLLRLLAKLLSGLIKTISLGWLNSTLGVLFALLNTALILGLLLMAFNSFNASTLHIDTSLLDSSLIYKWISGITETLFPFIENFFNQIYTMMDQMQGEAEANAKEAVENTRTIKWFFRGQSRCSWSLRPSLFRPTEECKALWNITKDPKYTFWKEEQYLFQEARRFSPEGFVHCRTDIEQMAVAQHFRVPTRLLDVSESALVALYFATEIVENPQEDGKVFVFRFGSDGYKIGSTIGATDKVTFADCHSGRFPGALRRNHFLVLPPFMTSRQRAQSGAFLLCTNDGRGCLHEIPSTVYRAVTIPAAAKLELRSALEEMCGISARTLFPDMIDGCRDRVVKCVRQHVLAENGL